MVIAVAMATVTPLQQGPRMTEASSTLISLVVASEAVALVPPSSSVIALTLILSESPASAMASSTVDTPMRAALSHGGPAFAAAPVNDIRMP